MGADSSSSTVSAGQLVGHVSGVTGVHARAAHPGQETRATEDSEAEFLTETPLLGVAWTICILAHIAVIYRGTWTERTAVAYYLEVMIL